MRTVGEPVEAPGVVKRLFTVLLALVLLGISGGMAWAVADDLQARDVVPAKVSLVSPSGEKIDVGGLTRAELAARVATAIVDPVLQPVAVRYGELEFTFDVRAVALVRVDAAAVSADAFQQRESAALAMRVIRRLADTDPQVEVIPRYTVDTTAIQRWVASVARQVDRRAVDATRSVVGNRVVIKASAQGLRVDRTAAADAIERVVMTAQATPKIVLLPASVLKPKVTEASFGRAIVVDKSERRLYLYNGAKIENSYRVAVGMPGFPTPLGEFQIVLKRYRPTWSNPGSNWAKSMPPYIPPGPGNPLGTRALNLSAPGIRIHGTENVNSIGTAASHGCIRMLRANVEELYDLVEVGTTVYVVL